MALPDIPVISFCLYFHLGHLAIASFFKSNSLLYGLITLKLSSRSSLHHCCFSSLQKSPDTQGSFEVSTWVITCSRLRT